MMEISPASYSKIRNWLKQRCGVELGDARQTMVCARLSRRLALTNQGSVDEYIRYIEGLNVDHHEWTYFIDVLTTHETYFYREAAHFDFLKQIVFPSFSRFPIKILSAACSTGEETYTLAIEAANYFESNSLWHIAGTDISQEVINVAQRGHYQESRAKLVPQAFLKKYFLKGTEQHIGTCLVKNELRKQVDFFVSNILKPIPGGSYDVIFCRNVLIYFDMQTKQKVIENLINHLSPNGYLFISQTEQLRGLVDDSWMVTPSILRKPEANGKAQ